MNKSELLGYREDPTYQCITVNSSVNNFPNLSYINHQKCAVNEVLLPETA
jgi:hypothetical protein